MFPFDKTDIPLFLYNQKRRDNHCSAAFIFLDLGSQEFNIFEDIEFRKP
jgi:hypothetical protein